MTDSSDAQVPATGSNDEEKEAKPAPDVKDLRELRRVVEATLSKDQILSDGVLQFNMNEDLMVLATIVAVHPKIVAAGGTAEKVVAIAKESPKLTWDDETKRIGPKATRTTLMMRDFPDEVSQSDVQEFLNGSPQSEDVCSIRGEANSILKTTTYFVIMDTEESTLNLALWLRGKKIKDVDIRASVKSEAFSDLLKEQVKNTQQVMQDVMQRQLAYAQYQQQYSMAMYQHAMAYQMAAAPTPKSSSKSKKLEQKDKQSGSKSQNFSSTSPKNQKKLQASKSMPAQLPKSAAALSEPGFDSNSEGPKEGSASKRYTRAEIIEICKRMQKVDIPPAFAKAGGEQKLLRTEPCIQLELEKAAKA